MPRALSLASRGALIAAVLCLTALVSAPSASAGSLHALSFDGCFEDVATAGVDCAETQGLHGATDVAVSPDGNSVYVVSPVDDAIARFNRAADGTLTQAGCISAGVIGCASTATGMDGATGVAVSPDGNSVYVASNVNDAIVRFNRAPSGALSFAGCFDDFPASVCGGPTANALDGARSVAVSPDGASVYVVSFDDEAITRFDRAADGSLTDQGCKERLGGAQCGAGNSTDGLVDAMGVGVSPDGEEVYVATQSPSIVAFHRAAGGAITPFGCPATPCVSGAPGIDGATEVAVAPDGAEAYVADAGWGSVVELNRSGSGLLSFADCIEDPPGPAADDCFDNETQGLAQTQGVAVSPDGDSVFTVSPVDEAIVSFTRAGDGSLSPRECFADLSIATSCATLQPGLDGATGVAVSPNGASVYVAAAANRSLVNFSREVPPVCRTSNSTGAPGAVQTVPLDCTDPNGDSQQISIVKQPANGTLGPVSQANSTVPYTPNAGFAGVDSFEIRSTAEGNTSNVATVFVGVQSATGPQGAQGAQGPQGPPGRDATVTCRSKGKRVKCSVVFAAAAGVTKARLSRRGVTYADGVPSARGENLVLRFRSSRRLRPGRYTLTVIQHLDGNRVATKSAVRVR